MAMRAERRLGVQAWRWPGKPSGGSGCRPGDGQAGRAAAREGAGLAMAMRAERRLGGAGLAMAMRAERRLGGCRPGDGQQRRSKQRGEWLAPDSWWNPLKKLLQ